MFLGKAFLLLLALSATPVLGDDVRARLRRRGRPGRFRNRTTAETKARFVRRAGGIAVKFARKGGRFFIFSADRGDDGEVSDVNVIKVGLARIREVSEDGSVVGESSRPKHAFGPKILMRQDWDASFADEVQIGTAKANVVTLKLAEANIGSIQLDTYIVTEGGEVSPNPDDPSSPVWNVSRGDVKFTINIDNWKWCNPCGTDEIGAFLDVDLAVKSASVPRRSKRRPEWKNASQWELGGNIQLELDSEVMLDGKNSTMPEDFPKITTLEGRDGLEAVQVLQFRFPHFTESASYDPIVGSSHSSSLAVDDGARGPFMGLAAVAALLTYMTQ